MALEMIALLQFQFDPAATKVGMPWVLTSTAPRTPFHSLCQANISRNNARLAIELSCNQTKPICHGWQIGAYMDVFTAFLDGETRFNNLQRAV